MENPTKILIVDDKKENLVVLERLLADFNVTLVRAYSGNEAVAKTLEDSFAIALIDVQMPDMDGFETAELIHQEEKNKFMPIIFISAIYSEKYHRIKGVESGAIDFITKPLIPEILKGKVKLFLGMYKFKIGLEKEIEHRKILENERKNLYRDLQQKNKELEDILYVTSHDLRSPIVNIDGFVSELKYALFDLQKEIEPLESSVEIKEKFNIFFDEDVKASFKYINSGIKKINLLFQGLLKVSRLGRIILNIQKINMDDMINQITNQMLFKIKEKKIKITVNKLPDCFGDSTQINQIFSNLIDNAIKYLSSERPGEIEVSGKEEEGYFVYSIKDNGIGIPEKNKSKIFIIFQRLREKKDVEGDGIGLSYVQKLVEKHNGKVWVESEQGKGSTFYVSIPVRQESLDREAGIIGHGFETKSQ